VKAGRWRDGWAGRTGRSLLRLLVGSTRSACLHRLAACHPALPTYAAAAEKISSNPPQWAPELNESATICPDRLEVACSTHDSGQWQQGAPQRMNKVECGKPAAMRRLGQAGRSGSEAARPPWLAKAWHCCEASHASTQL